MPEFLIHDLQQWHDIATVVLAGALGALIGLERELAGKPAGFRTHALVAAGSALMVVLGAELSHDIGSERLTQADPTRILQAIVVGISFLGAGTIIRDRQQQVEGLTTAASIFVTAGVGICVAVDRPWLAAEVVLFALCLLRLAGWIEYRLPRSKQDAASSDR